MVIQRHGIIGVGDDGSVNLFRERHKKDGSQVNIGYIVLNPEVFNYIDGNDVVFEKEPLNRLVKKRELMTFKHNGFRKCMDTQKEKMSLSHYGSQTMHGGSYSNLERVIIICSKPKQKRKQKKKLYL